MTSWIREAKARKYPPCPTCKATQGAPCRTPMGRSRKPHATRMRVVVSQQTEAPASAPKPEAVRVASTPEVYGVAAIGPCGGVLTFDLEPTRQQAREAADELNAHLAKLTIGTITWKPARLMVDA